MLRLGSRLFSHTQGATAIEYAVMASLISIALVTSGSVMGGTIGVELSKIGDKLSLASSK